jgi:hypothetical protein
MLRIRFVAPLLAAAILAGCSSEPERFAIEGSVSLDGKPLSNCLLVFRSLNSSESTLSATAIVSEGKFEVAKQNGLVEGDYLVVFTEIQPDLDEYEAARTAGSKNALNKKVIPTKYTVANSLRIKVASGMQPIMLPLKSR